MGIVDKIHICKMKLTSLHDLYDSWHLHIRRFLFGLSTLFWILTSWMSDVNKPDVGILICWVSDVGFLQVGCRIFASWMSDFYKSHVGCRIFKVGYRMAPTSFRSRAHVTTG